ADKIEISAADAIMQPADITTLNVQIFTDVKLEDGEGLEIVLQTFGAFPSNLFDYQINLLETKFYTSADLQTMLSDSADAKYFVYNFEVKFSINQEYRAQDFANATFEFAITSKTALLNQQNFGFKLVYKPFEITVNNQEILSVTINHFEIQNKSVLLDQTQNTNFVFYEYNTKNSNNIIAPGEEGLLQIDIYPSFATWDYLDITYTQQNGQDLSLALAFMEKYVNPQNGNAGFRQSHKRVQTLENGIRIFGVDAANTNAVTTLYLGTYLPISTNKDAVFDINLVANNQKVSSFNLVVEYLEDAMIQIVDNSGNSVSTVARGTTSTLLITLPKEQNLTLDFVNILGVTNGLGGAEKSISLTRTQIIEDAFSLTRTYAYALEVGSEAQLDNAENYITIEVTTSWIVNGKMQRKVSTCEVGIVDFKVDQITLLTDKADKSTFYSYIGVQNILNFDFDGKSNTNQNPSFQAFLQNFYYESLSNTNSYGNYVVNVGKAGKASFLGNLYYVNGSTQYALLNDDGSFEPNNYFTFTEENGQIKIIGKRQGEVNLRFVMQIQYPHTTITNLYEISFDFTIVVAPFSDEDLPLIIDNETAFYDAFESDTPQDYILMNDLYLENVSPLSTNAINSLDGNNFTIHIKSFNTETESNSLSLALFDNVAQNTTLKNLTINLYGDNQIDVNTNVVDELRVAGLAISNDGIIYNCQVVAYAENQSANAGIDVSYGGNITDTFISITAGFVVTNNGFITNSRVGGTTLEKVNGKAARLEVFDITAQGNISGFVDTNSGTISSSFFANGTLTNATIGTLSSTTSGFARYNTGTITTSYAKGTGEDAFTLLGKGITTAGTGAGFIAINNGEISNCYANILLASQDLAQSGRLSAGFVHSNMGKITSCFTASKIENAKTTQMAFVGVDDAGNLLNTGTIKNGYYYNADTIEGDAYSNQTANLNVVRVAEPNNPDNFYGFSFADSATSVNGVWFSTGYGIDLVSANQIAVSNRYIANEKRDEITGELLSYNLPYTAGYEYGSQINPIIIRTAAEFNRAVGGDHENAGTAISQYYNLGQQTVFGNYRIISNINLQDLNPDNSQTASISSTNMTLDGGVLDGNMLMISGLDLTANSDTVIENFGLFKALQNNACIKNLSISVVSVSAKQVRFVGTLAGTVENSKILSITIKNQSDIADSTILGNNVVGGLVGLVSGQSEVKDITITSLGVKANALATTSQNFVRGITNQSLSYAGGVIGIADIFTSAEKSSWARKTETQTSNLSNLVANGNMQVRASTAGGVIGLLGPQTNLRDATFESPADIAKIVAYNFYAGGIVGECFGNIDMAKAQHDAITQKQIENNVSAYYQNPENDIQRGNLDLFDDTSDGYIISTYAPVAIGGIVGNLITGEIQHSYSKLNVKNPNSNFAGGLVGKISACQNPKHDRNKITFFETYAFGDVLANDAAGGAVGYIENTRTVIMTKVNAVNLWGLVLDKDGEYHIPDNAFQIYGATNAGNVNTLATYDVKNNVVSMNGTDALPKIITTSNPEDMFAITEVKFASGSDAISEYIKPSFAFMEGGAPYNLVYDPYYGLQTNQKTGAEEISSQAVTPYFDLTDPATNGLAMDTYFIQANWDSNYWVRYTQTNDLLPSLVTFTESMCYYIDVAADLQKMLYHPYATFIVRGLNQPSTIIPVGNYIENTNLILANFSGTLKGMDNSLNYGFDFEGKSSFILATTGASFYNLTIQEIGRKGNALNSQNQAFIDTATQTSFENILIKDCYATTQISETNFNVGLLANKLVGGYMNGISVQDSVVDARVAQNINANELPFINVGMVAGQLQTLGNAICQITDVCVYQTSSESNFQNNGTNNVQLDLNGTNLENTEISIGAIFGETIGNVATTFSSKSAGDLVKGIGVATSTLAKYHLGASTAQNPKGTVLTLSGSGNVKTFNAGLLFGKVNTMKVAFARTVQTQKLQVVGGINQTGDALGNFASISQANLGGIIGKVETTASIQNTTTGATKFAATDVGTNFVAKTINAGGLVGLAANLSKIENLETFGEINAKGTLETNLGGLVGTLNSSIEIANTVSNTNLKFVGQNAFVGGILGAYTATSGTLVLGDENFGTKYMGQIIVSGENIAAGGILGALKADTNILSQSLIQNAVFDGEITLSKMTGDAWIGGILGNSKSAASITAPNVTLSNCLALGDINVLHDYYAQNGLGVKVYVGGLVGLGSDRTTLSNNTSLVSLASKTASGLDGVHINALVGQANGAKAAASESNFYAHQMSLCLDFNDGIGATNLYYKQTTQASQFSILDLLEPYIATLFGEPEEGTKLNPIEIDSMADMQNAAEIFAAEKTKKVVGLITGPFTYDQNITPLDGKLAHLMGDGHQIITHSTLFASIDEKSAIAGLSLVPSIEKLTPTTSSDLNASAVGTVANINNGFVFACAVKTTNISAHEHTSLAHTGSAYVGGIVGYNTGVIMDSFSAINITANGNAGGVAGYNSGNIISTYSVGNVDGGFAFTQGDGAVYSSYTASPATAGVFGTNQTVVDSFYDLYSVGKKSSATETTDTKTFSVLDTAENKKLLFENAQSDKKFAYVVGENFGYPTFAASAYANLDYMRGIATGTGAEDDPMFIGSVGKLQQISDAATNNLHYQLICDMAVTDDMKSMFTTMKAQTYKQFNKNFAVIDWAPIANFKGTLSGAYGEDGKYAIQDFTTSIERTEWAIFGKVENANISNLEIKYSSTLEINAKTLAGLATEISGTTLDNITLDAGVVKSTAAGTVALAGLVGATSDADNDSKITNINLEITKLQADKSTNATIGGLIANMQSTNATMLKGITFANGFEIVATGTGENIGGGLAGNVSNVFASEINFKGEISITNSGSASAIFGGLAGNAQTISSTNVTLDNISLTSTGTGQTTFGGFFGTASGVGKAYAEDENNNSVQVPFSANAKIITLTSNSTTAEENCLGGIAGTLANSVIESASESPLSVTGINITQKNVGTLVAGGIAGSDAGSTIKGFAPAATIANEKAGLSNLGGIVGNANGTEIHAKDVDLQSYKFIFGVEDGKNQDASELTVGGLVGFAQNQTKLNGISGVTTVKNNLAITDHTKSDIHLGGLAGYLDGSEVNTATIESIKLEGTQIGAVASYITGSTLQNVTISNPDLTASFNSSNIAYAGGVAGKIENNSTLSNVKIDGGTLETGDIPTKEVEDADGNKEDVEQKATSYIGGFAGSMSGTIDGESTSTLEIKIKTGGFAGGLVGKGEDLSIIGVNISSSVSANLEKSQKGSDLFVGGIVGDYDAGKVGEDDGQITNTTFTGNVSSSDVAFVGGIAGKAKGKFTNITIGGNITELATYDKLCAPSGVAVGGVAGSANDATFTYITVQSATKITGTYIAGGIVGLGSDITITGSASQDITGTNNYYDNNISGIISTEGDGNEAKKPLVTASYAGGVVGKVSGTSTIEACKSTAIVQAGWKTIASNDKLTARDFFWYDSQNDDEYQQDKTKNKLKKRVQQVNAASKGAETAYAAGIAGYASDKTTFKLVENGGTVTAKAKPQLAITSSSRYDVQNIWGYYSYDAYAHYAKETENAYAAGVAAFMSPESTLEKCLNSGTITGGGEVEFNLFTTDEDKTDTDNLYKTYALGYSFTYTEDGGKKDINNLFEEIYKNDPAGTQAWIKAEKEGIKLVGAANASNDYYKYETGSQYGFTPLANSADAGNYVVITDWSKTGAETQNLSQTRLHYAEYNSYYYPLMASPNQNYGDRIMYDENWGLGPHDTTASNSTYCPPFYFLKSVEGSTVTLTGPYIHIYETKYEYKDPETGNTTTRTDYSYYEPEVDANGKIVFNSSNIKNIRYGDTNWQYFNNNVSNGECYIESTNIPVATYQGYYLGSTCNFPAVDNFSVPSNAFELSNTDGKVYINKQVEDEESEAKFTLSNENIQLIIFGMVKNPQGQMVESPLPIVQSQPDNPSYDYQSYVKGLPFPDKEPYDSIA
ncbi:MAG: hypothetical protein IJ959_02465, partial [Clostridia bacterium]|nr:hypothetical protein [Clostridia bacterium]